MSTYWVCSDNIDGKENSRIEALCSALKKNGHKAHNGGVGPNTIQSHGQTSGAKGQIGVFICGGVDIQVFWDFVQGIGRYYNYKRFVYVYASDTATTDKWLTCNGAKNTKTVQAWDDNYSGGQGDAIGKTVDAYCNEHKDKISYACGSKGCKFSEVIDNFLQKEGIKGGGGSSEGGLTKKVSQGGAIKEALQKLLTHWDGQVECYIRGREVHVNKVRNPEKFYIGILQEGVNIFTDSVTVTDVNPNTTNYLEVRWKGGIITIKDENLIKRFGVVRTNVIADDPNVKSEDEIKKEKEEKKKSESSDSDTDNS